MKNRLYWGLGILILLVVGFVFYKQYADIQQFQQDAAESQKLREEKTKPKQAEVTRDTRQPPPGKTFDTSGHWHNGEWHDAPHTDLEKAQLFELSPPDTATDMTDAEIKELYGILEKYGLDGEKLSPKQVLYLSKVGVSWDLLTPEQQRLSELYHYEENGLNPPPEGYKYVFKDLGVPKLDENGDAIIHKIGDREATKSFVGYLRESSNK